MMIEKNFRGKTFNIMEGKTSPHSSIYTFEDEQVVRDRWWNIQQGDVVLDIGAAFGSYTLPALALGANMVYAWSPDATGEDMINNLGLNPGFMDRCKVYRYGLYSREGFFHTNPGIFYDSSDNDGRLVAKVDEAAGDSMITVTTLDRMVDSHICYPEKIDWIKIDVEGAELEVLRGAAFTIRKYRPKNILVENHNFKDSHMEKKITKFMFEELVEPEYYGRQVQYTSSVSHTLWCLR